jgi:hypothetical protein
MRKTVGLITKVYQKSQLVVNKKFFIDGAQVLIVSIRYDVLIEYPISPQSSGFLIFIILVEFGQVVDHACVGD